MTDILPTIWTKTSTSFFPGSAIRIRVLFRETSRETFIQALPVEEALFCCKCLVSLSEVTYTISRCRVLWSRGVFGETQRYDITVTINYFTSLENEILRLFIFARPGWFTDASITIHEENVSVGLVGHWLVNQVQHQYTYYSKSTEVRYDDNWLLYNTGSRVCIHFSTSYW